MIPYIGTDVANRCDCVNGNAVEDADCTAHGDNQCSYCENNYHLNGKDCEPNTLEMYRGKVYVQAPVTINQVWPSQRENLLRLASYHLESISNSYIYYGPSSHYRLDNGQSFPEKNYFKDVFISEDGYFNGIISWTDDHQTTMLGADTEVYKFKQKEGSLSNCLVGYVRVLKEGREIKIISFGDQLVYSEW